MTRSLTFSLVTSALITMVAFTNGKAAPIVAGDTTFFGEAIQDVTIYGGTVFNPGAQFTLYGLSGDGYFTIDRQAESGNSIAFSGVSAFYAGSYPGLGSYTFGSGGTVGLGSFSGTIDNVTQNPNDPGYASGEASSFASGDYTANIASFYFQLANGTILETGSCTLTATLDGLPPRSPTVLQQSPIDDNPIYLGDPANGILVGFTTNATINLEGVPEPSSLVLLAAGIVGMGIRHRKRTRV